MLEMSWGSGVEEMSHRKYTTHVAATVEEVSANNTRLPEKSQSSDIG